jgi:hypothetical protein
MLMQNAKICWPHTHIAFTFSLFTHILTFALPLPLIFHLFFLFLLPFSIFLPSERHQLKFTPPLRKRFSEIWTPVCMSNALNVYTRQNPRRYVVLKKTSQMRTICTQTGRNLSVYLSLCISFFPGGDTFL